MKGAFGFAFCFWRGSSIPIDDAPSSSTRSDAIASPTAPTAAGCPPRAALTGFDQLLRVCLRDLVVDRQCDQKAKKEQRPMAHPRPGDPLAYELLFRCASATTLAFVLFFVGVWWSVPTMHRGRRFESIVLTRVSCVVPLDRSIP